MLYTQAQRHRRIPLPTPCRPRFSAAKFRCRTAPLPEAKLLYRIGFPTPDGVFRRLIYVFSLLAGRCRSIAARRVDPVEERPALLEAADIVKDDRGGGRRGGEGGDVRGHDDARVMPERVAQGQRLIREEPATR